MMFRFSIAIVRPLLILMVLFQLIPASTGEPETTFILIDHSASMSPKDKQERVDIITAYYANHWDTKDISFSYFGSDNGGDCASKVQIEPAGENQEIPKPDYNAKDQTPLISAIDETYQKIGTQKSTIVVLTDGEEACNPNRSVCMAVKGYRHSYPLVDLRFEGILPSETGKAFLKCVEQKAGRAKTLNWPSFNFHSTALQASKTPRFHLGVLHLYFCLSVPFLMFSHLVWGKVSRTTDLVSRLERQKSGTRADATEAGKLKRKLPRWFWTYAILMLVAIFWGVAGRDEVWNWWKDSLFYMNTRLGAAVATVVLGTLLGFLFLAMWKNGLLELENQFIEASKLETARGRAGYLSDFERTHTEFVETLRTPNGDDREQEEQFNSWKKDFDTFYFDLLAKLKVKIVDESWNTDQLPNLKFVLKPRSFRARLRKIGIESSHPEFIERLTEYV